MICTVYIYLHWRTSVSPQERLPGLPAAALADRTHCQKACEAVSLLGQGTQWPSQVQPQCPRYHHSEKATWLSPRLHISVRTSGRIRWTPPMPSAPSSPWSYLKPSTLNFAAIFCIFWTMVSARLFSMELPLPTNYSSVVVVVQLLSRVQLFALPGLQHTMLLCPSLSPRVCSNSYPLSQWCYPTISTSVAHFCPQSFPASGSFPMSQLFPSGG